jgi:aspartokinase/homoserine dehydrogenase 1
MHLEETATTLISDTPKQELKAITGIASMNRIALVRIEGSGMIGVPGFAQRVFASLNQQRINVILISQDASEHALCFAVKQSDEQKALEQMKQEFATEIEAEVLQPIRSAGEVSIIGLVGESMRNHPGVSGRMFSALGRNGINILAIAQGSNERTISAVVRSADLVKAINVLHEAFFEDSKREINLYVVGTGNVGKKLIGQLANQLQQMEDTAHIKLNLGGICNSKKMLIDNQINLAAWDELLNNKGEKNNLDLFTETIIKLNRRNSVLVDVTASEIPPNYYERLLKKSVSVVACNKIAAASSYPFYHNLKQLAVSYNCKFLFETNVGAALPIIGTLNDLLKSGDRIKKIEAVLSGTLNYVFNNYDGNKPFAEVVRDAQREGYTEPDPRLDLSGKDVMRKIMILARETGEKMEMEEISCNSFLPESCMQGSVEEFYQEMGRHEDHFRQLLEAARSDQSTLKFVARYENGKASVGLQHIKPESEMFHLYGKDNIVLFYTERYTDQPLVVKGAGAGAEVTASGVFADIIRTINN